MKAKNARQEQIKKLEVELHNGLPWHRYKAAQAARRWLVRTWPDVFTYNEKRPLKIGIDQDIAARQEPGREVGQNHTLHHGLKDYTGGASYLRAMTEGAIRIDLDGNPAGVVSAEAAEIAAAKLVRIEACKAALHELHEAVARDRDIAASGAAFRELVGKDYLREYGHLYDESGRRVLP